MSCDVVFPACSTLMASFAAELTQNENCGQDYRRENPLIQQAYNGLIAYDALYHAGCQKDDRGRYCYANAITNASNPSDSYVYFLPLGIPLPGPSKPSCSSCLQQTMTFFQDDAGNKSRPISTNYVDAARMIDLTCGPTFVNQTVPVTKGPDGSNSAASLSFSSSAAAAGTLTASALAAVYLALYF